MTGLKEFEVKDLRDIIIKQIFKNYYQFRMTKKDFVVLFKLDGSASQKKKEKEQAEFNIR